MEIAVNGIGLLSQFLVPLLALWAVAVLHAAKAEDRLSEALFYLTFLLVAGLTIRTMLCNDNRWLIDTFSLGLMVVGGVTKKSQDPEELPILGQ